MNKYLNLSSDNGAGTSTAAAPSTFSKRIYRALKTLYLKIYPYRE